MAKSKRHILLRTTLLTVHLIEFLVLVGLMLCNIGVALLLVHPSTCDIKLLKMNETDFCKNYGTKL